MEPTHNGQQPNIVLRHLCRLAPLSGDGTQWEARFHMIADLPDGQRMVGEIVLRTFEGGVGPMEDLVGNGFKLIRQALVQQRTGLTLVTK